MSFSRGRESVQRGWGSVDPGLIPTRGGEWGGGWEGRGLGHHQRPDRFTRP